MLITKIEVQKNDKTRANLYLDDKFHSGISIALIMKEQIRVGMDIDCDKLNQLILDDEKEKATSRVVKYISSSLKTQKQIREYLNKKGYNPVTIDYVIDKLIEYKYLDDSAYAKSYILTYSNKYGKLKLKQELKQKGVSEKIIDEELDKMTDSNSIRSVAEKYMRNKECTWENLQKLSRFLYSRGYNFDEINSCVNELREE